MLSQLTSVPVTVATIFPVELPYNRPYRSLDKGGYHTDYTLPAAVNREVSVLVVTDALQREYAGNDKYSDISVPALAIAKDVVRHAKDGIIGVTGDVGPGIWVCSGPLPSEKEVRYWQQQQVAWARIRVSICDRLYFEQKYNDISDLDRAIGEWMGLDALKHKWLRPIEMGDTKSCPFCRTVIPAPATICSACSQIIDPAGFEAQKRLLSEAEAAVEGFGRGELDEARESDKKIAEEEKKVRTSQPRPAAAVK